MALDDDLRLQDGEETIIGLATITHPSLMTPLYLARNGVDVVSRGLTFRAAAWEMTLPATGEEAISEVVVRVPNVDRAIVDALLESTIKPTISIELALASDPDVIEMEIDGYELRDVSGDAQWIEGVLALPDHMTEPAPYQTFAPSRTPGLFL